MPFMQLSVPCYASVLAYWLFSDANRVLNADGGLERRIRVREQLLKVCLEPCTSFRRRLQSV